MKDMATQKANGRIWVNRRWKTSGCRSIFAMAILPGYETVEGAAGPGHAINFTLDPAGSLPRNAKAPGRRFQWGSTEVVELPDFLMDMRSRSRVQEICRQRRIQEA
jgi:hypothetical protein